MSLPLSFLLSVVLWLSVHVQCERVKMSARFLPGKIQSRKLLSHSRKKVGRHTTEARAREQVGATEDEGGMKRKRPAQGLFTVPDFAKSQDDNIAINAQQHLNALLRGSGRS